MLKEIYTSANNYIHSSPTLPKKITKNTFLATILVWTLAIASLAVMLIFQPSMVPSNKYTPDQLATTLKMGKPGGFYTPEVDESGNRFVWTDSRPTITFAFQTQELLQLSFEVRSAKVAGGPDTPIEVWVNGIKEGQFTPEANNLNFQSFSFQIKPPPSSSPNLQIQLVTTLYRSPGDNRQLGTMLKSFSIQSVTWSNISSRVQVIFWVLMLSSIILLGLILLSSSYNWKVLNYISIGLSFLSLALVAFAVRTFGKFLPGFFDNTYYMDKNVYLLWVLSFSYLSMLFFVTLVYPTFGRNRIFNFYRRSYQFLNKHGPHIEPPKSKIKGQIDALTGLRFIAVLLVFCVHVPHYPDTAPDWLRRIMLSGLVGVPLFFILSGFVICFNYYDRLLFRFSRNLWPYFVARIARIYPMHLFTLGLALLINLQTPQFRPDPVTKQFKIVPDVLFQHIFMISGWNLNLDVTSAYLFNGPSWSLTVEFFLYFSFPVLAWTVFQIFTKIWSLMILGVLACISAFAVPAWITLSTPSSQTDLHLPLFWVDRFPPTFLNAFILGCVAARIFMILASKPVTRRESWLGLLAFILASTAVIWIITADSTDLLEGKTGIYNGVIPYFFRSSSIYLPFFTVIIFCLARYRSIFSKLLSTRLFVLLGEASFSFYLLHYYVITINYSLFDTHVYYYTFGAFVVAYLLALGCYTYIETPLRILIRKLTR